MSSGEIIDCNRNEKLKIIIISGSLLPAITAINIRHEHINALSNEGDNPANHTNIIKEIIRIINESLFRPILFPMNMAIEENMERCIPDNARICERPEFLKFSDIFDDVYSFAPHSNVRSKPPASPHAYISLLN